MTHTKPFQKIMIKLLAYLRERITNLYANADSGYIAVHLDAENCEKLAGRVQAAIRNQFPKAKAEVTRNRDAIVIGSGSEIHPRTFFDNISHIIRSILNNGEKLPAAQEENP